jgi:hypothetical protein
MLSYPSSPLVAFWWLLPIGRGVPAGQRATGSREERPERDPGAPPTPPCVPCPVQPRGRWGRECRAFKGPPASGIRQTALRVCTEPHVGTPAGSSHPRGHALRARGERSRARRGGRPGSPIPGAPPLPSRGSCQPPGGRPVKSARVARRQPSATLGTSPTFASAARGPRGRCGAASVAPSRTASIGDSPDRAAGLYRDPRQVSVPRRSGLPRNLLSAMRANDETPRERSARG